MQFEVIPIDIMLPYAEMDALLTFRLAKELLELLAAVDASRWAGRRSNVELIANESAVTSVVFEMEKLGIGVDLAYVEDALAYERNRYEQGTQEFERKTGERYVPSSPRFAAVLQAHGVDAQEFRESDKGNVICDGATLQRVGGDIAECILGVKDAKSRTQFFSGFKRFTDKSGRLHTDFKQGGTKTGRFSSASPNMQNLTKPEENAAQERFPIRRAIVPDDGCALVMFDYEQMEYRMMLDYAGQTDLIEKVRGGLDVHQATADLTGITRTQAKTLNFALLYGAGSTKIAGMLGIEPDQAMSLISDFYTALPRVEIFMQNVRNVAKKRLNVCNWYGRRMIYTEQRFTYAAVNHVIQGGCGDVLRVAMVNIAKLLKPYKTTMNLGIHDELVFNMPPKEYGLVPEITALMVSAYPHRTLPMGVSVSHSLRSLADKSKGAPVLNA